jgi:hypothetical protein
MNADREVSLLRNSADLLYICPLFGNEKLSNDSYLAAFWHYVSGF